MESLYLKTLVEVVRVGSLSRAAETLHLTQPAISRRIKFLEEQYGCSLLDRSTNPVRPTDAGRLVVDQARRLLEIEADLLAGLDRLGGQTRIAFCSTPAFGIAHLPAILRDFLLVCGDTSDLHFISATPADMVRALGEGTCDAAVVESCNQFDLSAFDVSPLPEADVLFVSAPSLKVPSPVTSIDNWLAVPFFTRRVGCCSRTLLEVGLERLDRRLGEFRRVVVLDDLHTLMQTVLAGEGMSFLSSDLVGEHVAAGRLVVHRLPGFQHSRQRALVLAQPPDPSTPLATLATIVRDRFDLTLHPGRVVAGSRPPAPSARDSAIDIPCEAERCGTLVPPPGRPGRAHRQVPAGHRTRRPARRHARRG